MNIMNRVKELLHKRTKLCLQMAKIDFGSGKIYFLNQISEIDKEILDYVYLIS